MHRRIFPIGTCVLCVVCVLFISVWRARMEQVLPFTHIEYDRSAVEAGDISNFTAEEYLSWVRYVVLSYSFFHVTNLTCCTGIKLEIFLMLFELM